MESKKKTVKAAYYLLAKETQEPIPLESIHIHTDVVGSVATYKMTQKYVNIEKEEIETVFLFPMDATVVISKVNVKFTLPDGTERELETLVDEKKKVEIKYEDAVATGKTAVMGGYVAR